MVLTLAALIASITVFVLAIFLGFELISKVPPTLHTPLMSGANAIHGIILLGAVLVTGQTESTPTLVVGLVAIVLAAVNLVGGFVVASYVGTSEGDTTRDKCQMQAPAAA